MNNKESILHISHVDSDGYSCQYITNQVFDNIKFKNINYSNESINEIINLIQDANCEHVILTDISLTRKELEEIYNTTIEDIKSMTYIDHHQLEENLKEKPYLFIYHDEKMSSTGIINSIFNNKLELEESKKCDLLAELIDIYDLDKTENLNFKKSTIINDACMAAWCNPFNEEQDINVLYRIEQIKSGLDGLYKELEPFDIDLKLNKDREFFFSSLIDSDRDNNDLYDYLAIINNINREDSFIFNEKNIFNSVILKKNSCSGCYYLEDILNEINDNDRNNRIEDSLRFKYLMTDECCDKNDSLLRRFHEYNKNNIINKFSEQEILIFNNEDQMMFHSISSNIMNENNKIKLMINVMEDRVSIRTKSDYRADFIARDLFNGGGHKQIAGGKKTIPMEHIEKTMKDNLEKYKIKKP